MFMAALILVLATGLFLFYLQAVCQKLLQQRSNQEFYQSIVMANRLEFPLVRKGIENFGSPGKYSRLAVTLKCDFLTLTYLLKSASNFEQRHTRDERLLMLYFQLLFVYFVTCHWLRWGEKTVVLKLTAILQYFANVLGERVHTVRFGSLAAERRALDI